MFGRRRANKPTSNGKATEVTTKKAKKDKTKKPEIYEMACDVTGDVNTLDNNGRLVSTKQPRRDDDDVIAAYADAATFGGYGTAIPVQVSQTNAAKSQADKKRAARAGKTGEVGIERDEVVEKDRITCDSANDITLVDNALYDR